MELIPTKEKRIYKNIFTIKVEPSKGGGTTNVEEKASMSINEMYARMLKLGEIKNVEKLNNHGSMERADSLLKDAKPAPLYMKTGEHNKILNKMADVQDKMKQENKAKEENNKIAQKAEEMLKAKESKAV